MYQDYIERGLKLGDKVVTEEELLSRYEIIIVLAEPGAGKSELLRRIATRMSTAPIRASLFRHREIPSGAPALVIDALDELAKIDQSAIDQVIEKARATEANLVVMASRSSEWDTQRTYLLKEAFGIEPAVIRLQPFTREEQKTLFEQHVSGEDFARFSDEVARFELSPLLGNPQFLKLFADAYVRRGRHLVSKRQIFVDAIEKLASESSFSEWQRSRPPLQSIVAIAEELFAKTILAGASGLSVADGDRDFPYLFSLSAADPGMISLALNTRLFKPTHELTNHEPVHRIVAEYCAARYLVYRVEDKADNLVLSRVMSVVAPNNVVRDELRGLLGWMASLGNLQTQEACIRIDPYAVLANGDPSQLSSSSKRLLLKALQALSEVDPYFRRSDAWRHFSVAGLLTPDVIVDVRTALAESATSSDLRNLLLELLDGSSIASQLIDSVRDIVLDTRMGLSTRIRAQRILVGHESYDHSALINALVEKGDSASLCIAAESVEILWKSIELPTIVALLTSIGKKASRPSYENSDSLFNLRFQMTQMIAALDMAITAALLDELSDDLQCMCCDAQTHEAVHGASKIIGLLLDRYFELTVAPYNPQRIWRWARNLTFSGLRSAESSSAIKRLQEEDDLRQAVHLLALAKHPDTHTVSQTHVNFFGSNGHAGLRFKSEDLFAITSVAFETGDAPLWTSFYFSHNVWAEKKGPEPLRAHLRKHARADPRFLRIWAGLERDARLLRAKWQERRPRHRRWQLREDTAKENRAKYYRENRALIEAGQNWDAIDDIARCYLIKPDLLAEFLDDLRTADVALCNAFALLTPHTPPLADLSADRLGVTRMLHAACLATFRKERTLDHIDRDVLRVVKTDVGGFQGYRDNEAKAFEAEINRLIFSHDADVEAYARAFIEPQLSQSDNAVTDVGWLNYKQEFKKLNAHLPLEWLIRFPSMPHHARDTLFNLAAEHGERASLNALISSRCDAIQSEPDTGPQERNSSATFWLLRAFFFLPNPPTSIWTYLRSDPSVILSIEHYAGRTSRDDYRGWPTLSANKVFCILDIFIDAWPKVYLPSSWGTHSPDGERAYRFLTEVIYTIGRDEPQNAIDAFNRILADPRFAEFHAEAKSLKAAALRKRTLRAFEPPSAAAVNELLTYNRVASVEDLRTVLIHDFSDYQKWLRYAETNPLSVFHPGGRRLDENGCRNRIVDHLQAQMRARNLSVVIEQHFADSNRCDITAAAMVDGARRLIVVEVKGQWHRELFTAASAQLHERYSSHPDAAQQGIYLVLWFGPEESLAGRQSHVVKSPAELKEMIDQRIPQDIRGLIDVVVLDLSLPRPGNV